MNLIQETPIINSLQIMYLELFAWTDEDTNGVRAIIKKVLILSHETAIINWLV